MHSKGYYSSVIFLPFPYDVMLLPGIQGQLQKKLSRDRKIEVLPMPKTLKACEIWGRPGEDISSINTAIHNG